MKELHFGVELPFRTPEECDDSEGVLLWLLGVTSKINLLHLERNPETPLLYDTSIVYTPPDQADGRPELTRARIRKMLKLLRDWNYDPDTALMVLRLLRGNEIFLDIPGLLRRGMGDCNELVPMRVAELWRSGRIDAAPHLMKGGNDRGGYTYHAIVAYRDGSYEDPSSILGMGGIEARSDRLQEIEKNKLRHHFALEEGMALATASGISGDAVMKNVFDMGFVPRSGTFKSPYPYLVEDNAA